MSVRSCTDEQVVNGARFEIEPTFTPQPLQRKLQRPRQQQPTRAVSINSVVRVRLYPTTDQRKSLNDIFKAHRAIYNRIVVAVDKETKWRRALQTVAPEEGSTQLSDGEILRLSRDISVKKRMRQYFSNRRTCRRLKAMNYEVARSAQKDYITARTAALTNYHRMLHLGQRTSFPHFKFKSRLARSNSIELNDVSVHAAGVQFHTAYFLVDGATSTTPLISTSPSLLDLPETWTKEPRIARAALSSLPRLRHAARLQRLSGGEFFLVVPRARMLEPTNADRACAIDPGVHNFITLYDLSGRTASVHDEHHRIEHLQRIADRLKSNIAREKTNTALVRALMPLDRPKKHSREKLQEARAELTSRRAANLPLQRKSYDHRLRFRLRRQIRLVHRKISRLVLDLHHKVTVAVAPLLRRLAADISNVAALPPPTREWRSTLQLRG